MYGCDNDCRYQTSTVLRFYSHKQRNGSWEKHLQRSNFKAKKSAKVYSNHFASGYRCDTCEKPILYMKDYPDEGNNVKARENIDSKGKRKQHSKPDSEPSVKQCRDSHQEKELDSKCFVLAQFRVKFSTFSRG